MNALVPLLVVLPLAAAALLVAVLDRVSRPIAEAVALAVSLVALSATLVLATTVVRTGTAIVWFGSWHPGNTVGLGIAFAVDIASAAMAVLVAAVVCASIVYARQYFDDVGAIFYVLLLAMLGAMLAFAFAADAFDLFVFYEVFSVAAYALAAYRLERRSAFAGALQFAITSTIAGLFILVGITLLEGRTGELNLAAIGRSLTAQHAHDALTATSFAFVSVGLFARGAIAPLHFWFDEVHASAPTPLCAVLSGAMAPLALYAFARMYWVVYAPVLAGAPAIHAALGGIGTISAIAGCVLCMREPHLKRALAYSTVAHNGAILSAIASSSGPALADAALYACAYAVGAAGLLFAIGIVRSRTGTVDIRRLTGCGRALPLTAIAFALGTTALGGVWLLGRSMPLPLLVIVGAATGGTFGRAFWRMFVCRQRREPQGAGVQVPWFMLGPALAFGAIPIVMSVWGAVARLSARAAAALLDGRAYDAALMNAAVPASAPAVSVPAPALANAIVPLFALVVAWLGATPLRRVARVRVYLRGNLLLRAIDRVHSGNCGQYVAWIAATAALLAGAGALAP